MGRIAVGSFVTQGLVKAMAGPSESKKAKKRPTAQKRQIQNEKRRLINKAVRTGIRNKIRGFRKAMVSSQDKAALQESLNEIYALLDKAVKKNLFALNKVARLKSRLASGMQAVSA